jgi:prephenate dehydratase
MPKVTFQGELGAYSELAAREFFQKDTTVQPTQTFSGVFERVVNGDADFGMIPIENSLAGSIHENYDLLLEHDLVIVGEIKLRIKHHLIVMPGVSLEELRRVVSHPQALSQCRDFLKNLDGVTAEPVYDTAGSVKMLKESGARDLAAIASAQAAQDYGLEVLAAGIESNHHNYTRFLAIAKNGEPGEGAMKTSIVFSTQNKPGGLFKSLTVFALRDINLLKIESRPLFGSPWEYMFYLDLEGSNADEPCAKALGHLEELAASVRVLGTYEQGRTIEGHINRRQE